jgi:peptide chain release factor subunit 3
MELEEKQDAMDTTALPEVDDLREHINIVFIGHVDAGKSTISGQILYG